MKFKSVILILFVLMILVACGPSDTAVETAIAKTEEARSEQVVASEPSVTPEPTATPEPSATPAPTATPEPSTTPEPTATPEPTETPTTIPSPTPIPDDVAEQIKLAYRVLVFIQFNSEMLVETARQVEAGELGGFDLTAIIIVQSALVQGVEEALPQVTPLEAFTSSWDTVLATHEQSKDILSRWWNGEIGAAQVIEEAEVIVTDIRQAADEIDQTLADDYDFDPYQLAQYRQEVIDTVSEAFESSDEVTPIPDLEVRVGYEYEAYGYYHIVGEVVNETDQWFDFVKIVATLYDENGNVVGSDFTYISADYLAPNDVAVFTLSSNASGSVDSIASYELQVEGNSSDGPDYKALTVTVGNEYVEYGYYHLVGEVDNTGLRTCEFVKVVAGYYDAEGNLVGEGFTYTTLDEVPAGASSPFDLAAGNLAGPYDSYKVWVEGNCDG